MKTKQKWFQNPTLVIAIVIIALIVLMAAVAFFWTPMDPERMDTAHRFALPSAQHLLGTDQFGRDVLSRIMVGSQNALLVGLISVSLGSIVGILIGAVAGMANSKISTVIMRFIDGLMAFPGILLAMMLVAIIGKGLINAAIAIAVFMVPSFARVVYTMVLDIKSRLYIKACRSYGCNPIRLVVVHMIPDMLPRLITQFTASIGGAILTESSLSFLGLGIQPPSPSWGMMLSETRQFILSYPYVAIAPGVVLLITVLGFNLLGDALNDMLIGRD